MLRIYYIDRNQLRLDLADGIIELTKEIFPLDERIDPSEFPYDPYRYGEALYVKTKALMNYDYGETDREHNKEGEAVCREMISVIDRMRKFTPVFPKQITHLEGLAYNQLGMFISAGIKQLDLLIRKGLVQLPLDALKSHVRLCTSIAERENADIATSQIEQTKFMWKGSSHQQRGDVMSNFFSNSINKVLALPMG